MYRAHVLVCGGTGCTSSHSAEILEEMQNQIKAAGLENEVRSLLADGLDDSCTAMQAIGYKEIAAALRGDVSLSDAVELIKRSSRRYAKRQLTWLRRDASVRWILWDRQPDIPAACRRIVEECSL